jgi:HEAT repeat protein
VYLVLANLDGSEAVPALIKGLQEENYNVQEVCTKSLGYIGDITAIEPLEVFISKFKNPNYFPRQYAQAAIRMIKSRWGL